VSSDAGALEVVLGFEQSIKSQPLILMGEAKTGAERNLSAGCAIFIAYVPAKYERRRLTVFHSIQNSARIRRLKFPQSQPSQPESDGGLYVQVARDCNPSLPLLPYLTQKHRRIQVQRKTRFRSLQQLKH
jgi:hypothetical protein